MEIHKEFQRDNDAMEEVMRRIGKDSEIEQDRIIYDICNAIRHITWYLNCK